MAILKSKLLIKKGAEMRNLKLLYGLICSVILFSCSKNENPVEPEVSEKIKLTSYNEYQFKLNNFHVSIDSIGQLFAGKLHNIQESVSGAKNLYVVFRAVQWQPGFTLCELIWVR